MAVLVPGLPRASDAQEWLSRYPPDPGCRIAMALDRAPRPSDAATGTLVVLAKQLGNEAPLNGPGLQIHPLSQDSLIPAPIHRASGQGMQVFDSLPPGPYALTTRALGFWTPRVDTVVVRAGAVDTVIVRVETHLDGYRNVHNCRPRRFRRAGESACLQDPEYTPILIARARELASDAQRRAFKLPPFSEADIAVVRDESICDRASRAYGRPGDPPRRVIVLRMGPLYMVYDPHEPLYAGEFSFIDIFDLNWVHVFGLTT
jgi:hypothetical protein